MSTEMLPLDALHETDKCHVHHDPVSLYLSIFLCVGLVISYLPQLARIILKRSSQGFSPWFLLLGTTSSASSFLNVVALQWGLVRCCSELSTGNCAESMLGIVQVGLQWLMFVSVLILFLVYYPVEHRYEQAIALLDGNNEEQQQASIRTRARKAAKKAALRRSSRPADADETTLLLPPASTSRSGGKKRSAKSTDEDISSGSDNSDLDSIDSHIAQNYSTPNPAAADGDNTSSDEASQPADGGDADASDLYPDAARQPAQASSSAFSKLTPTFWPMWKAPASRRSLDAIEEGRAPSTAQGNSRNRALLAEAPKGLRRIQSERQSRLLTRKGPKTRRRKTEEWSLAIALAWVVAIHFVFITSITLLLVTSLPPKSFPPPEEMASFAQVGFGIALRDRAAHAFGPSSRLLVSRWAAFLGASATVLAAAQYLPQIVHTARTRLVGSLSIPMMCLQVPGSAIFVYSLALQPGTDWSSLAAYVITGVLQLVLLVLCISWRIRQHRAGLDDFGRPISMVPL